MPVNNRFIPQVFADIFPQWVAFYRDSPHDKALLQEVHLLWRCATVYLGIGKARFQIIREASEHMAGYGNFTFSSLRIEGDDIALFEKWSEENASNPLGVLENFTGDGFKISVSYVMDQYSFCVTVVGTKETKNHKEQGMSSWSDDLAEALAMCWYKHYVMCGGGEWPTKGHGGRWG
jgi:hypothetical protein